MKPGDDKTESKSSCQKEVKDMTWEERSERAKAVFERVVERNGDALTKLSKN